MSATGAGSGDTKMKDTPCLPFSGEGKSADCTVKGVYAVIGLSTGFPESTKEVHLPQAQIHSTDTCVAATVQSLSLPEPLTFTELLVWWEDGWRVSKASEGREACGRGICSGLEGQEGLEQ